MEIFRKFFFALSVVQEMATDFPETTGMPDISSQGVFQSTWRTGGRGNALRFIRYFKAVRRVVDVSSELSFVADSRHARRWDTTPSCRNTGRQSVTKARCNESLRRAYVRYKGVEASLLGQSMQLLRLT